ncbi:hypothetical protein [Actinomadura roseirufa]|uniref:hypothetical protein n=1 Tax=Actinomadura roseirufa TaxID=2094049 RepID=UPI001040F58A|nr:hypothetical protein [Actinomadura roseirufa]
MRRARARQLRPRPPCAGRRGPFLCPCGICGTLVDLGGGWWRCRSPRGDAREVFVPSWVDEPWRDVAERVAA